MPIKIDSTNGSITLTVEDGSGNVGLAIPRAGFLAANGNGANLTNVLTLSGGAMTGAITTNSTFDGVDIATRDGVLSTTVTTANAALPKAGGAMTGAITTNSTFDGVDIATRDGVLSTTVTTANAALPKAGGTMTGAIDMGSSNVTTTGKILFANMYAAVSDLPSASTYHGMFAHVHGTGKGYFAHGGAWIELANQTDLATATTTAGAALPKAGGAMTGAITTNSTFDGRDVAADGVTADAALPKAGGTMSGLVNMADQIIQRPVLKDYGETKVAMAAHAVDLELGNVFTYTLSSGQTLTFTNPPASGTAGSFTLILTNGGSATLTWPTSIDWPAATAPTLTSSGVDILFFTTCDGGTIWYGTAVVGMG